MNFNDLLCIILIGMMIMGVSLIIIDVNRSSSYALCISQCNTGNIFEHKLECFKLCEPLANTTETNEPINNIKFNISKRNYLRNDIS